MQVSARITITEAAKSVNFFGQSWSAWPDATFSDGGFDAGLLLRAGTNSGYRVQLSHKYQVVALVKWVDDTRADWTRRSTAGEITAEELRTRSAGQRAEYEQRLRALLTPAQAERYDKLRPAQKRPPVAFRR